MSKDNNGNTSNINQWNNILLNFILSSIIFMSISKKKSSFLSIAIKINYTLIGSDSWWWSHSNDWPSWPFDDLSDSIWILYHYCCITFSWRRLKVTFWIHWGRRISLNDSLWFRIGIVSEGSCILRVSSILFISWPLCGKLSWVLSVCIRRWFLQIWTM